MSTDPTPRSETPRTGKYCPRCHTMALRDQTVCRRCGHRFRTGTEAAAPAAESRAVDPVNRTMQFVLPPLPVRTAAPAPKPPVQAALDTVGRRRGTAAAGLAALLAALCLGAALLWQHSRRPPAPDLSPAGVWETTLHGRASANAQLEFAFDAGGTGRFSWHESGPAALSGETPLRWHLNPDGTLALALAPPASGDPVSQTLAGIFTRPNWSWRADRAQRRLVLGTLVFTEEQ